MKLWNKYWEKYKLWDNRNELYNHWQDRATRLIPIREGYKPRTKQQFLAYGKVLGELDCIERSLRVLKSDIDDESDQLGLLTNNTDLNGLNGRPD